MDTLTIIDFSDNTTLQDALATGVIHGAGALDGPQIASLATTSGIKTVVSHSGEIVPFTMRVDQPPFNDVNVRQAMRLLVDRPQLIDSALDSYGVVANDLFSPYDPRLRPLAGPAAQGDIQQAKFLLKKAGQEGLTVTLTTSAVATGTVAMATVLAAQAKAAGVTIKINNVPPGTFFGPNYLKWTFAQDYYNYYPYLSQVAESMLDGSPFNETHTSNPHYTSLYNQANATASPSLRKEILYEMQSFDFNQGGYIIPAYIDVAGRLQRQDNRLLGRQGRPAAVQLRLRALRLRRLTARSVSRRAENRLDDLGPGRARRPGPRNSPAPELGLALQCGPVETAPGYVRGPDRRSRIADKSVSAPFTTSWNWTALPCQWLVLSWAPGVTLADMRGTGGAGGSR